MNKNKQNYNSVNRYCNTFISVMIISLPSFPSLFPYPLFIPHFPSLFPIPSLVLTYTLILGYLGKCQGFTAVINGNVENARK